jgi:mannose-6-phosphate isomerase-like protein (cupin superfamily)
MKSLLPTAAFLMGIFLTLTFVAFTNAHQNDEGYIIEHERDIATQQQGPHNGGGETTAYSFFSKTPDLQLIFRKRVLYPGSSIGYHLQDKDEIYYIVSGRGELTMNGKTILVNAGDAILTRAGSSHGLKPFGKDSLTLIINYNK